ncbi:LysR family transcriptional regulator [Vibrio sp. JC009]|uniref:LysR family transcriptional regulator n=1 Tax=Vibrio sp. JC009 TaxID=2912314 RepID=UPI0023B1C66A|nr:LysR family transcriptional regulator [Vibrio sp. JC009]WED24923.1 LysR family transcriptional regulator [Vibrio sp. JC009]
MTNSSYGFIQNESHLTAVPPQLVVKMLFFLELINAGSITNASEALGVSKSTGSRWLSDLETELGLTLYQRNNPKQRLTEAGAFLYDKLSSVNADISFIVNELGQFNSEVIGRIKVCCGPTPFYVEDVVLALINDFIQQNSQVDIQLLVTPRAVDHHQESDFVISAISGSAAEKEPDLRLVCKNLLKQKFVTVASPEYIKEHGEPLVPGDLVEHRCLYSKTFPDNNEWIYKDSGQIIPTKIEKTLELSDAKMQLSAALGSMGISYLPEYILYPYLKSGRLVKLLEEYETDDWFLNIYYHPRQFMTHCVKEFKTFFLEHHEETVAQFKQRRTKHVFEAEG